MEVKIDRSADIPAEGSRPKDEEATILKNNKRAWLVKLFLILGLLGTAIAYWQTTILVQAELASKLDSRARYAASGLDQQMDAYVEVLRGLRTQFVVNPHLSRLLFQQATASLSYDQRLPGVKRIGFAQRVTPGERAELRDLLLREHRQASLGYPSPVLADGGGVLDSYIVRFAEPISQNASLLWADEALDPKRRVAIEQARDNGEWALSSRVAMSREAGNLDGVILYLPVYRGGVTPATLAMRRERFMGAVSLTLRLEDMMHSVFSADLLDDMRIRIHDGESEASAPRPDEARGFVYDSAAGAAGLARGKEVEQDAMSRRLIFPLGGRVWYLDASATPQFLHHSRSWLPPMVAVAGTLLSLLWFFIMRMLELSRQASLLHTREVERSLHSKEKQLVGITESIDEVLWTFDYPGWKINYVSPAVERVYGYEPDAFYRDPHLWLKCIHAADRQPVVAHSRRLIESGQHTFQYRIVRPDGTIRWIRYDAYFVPGNEPGCGRVDSVGSDITLQYLLEQSLLRSNRALRAMHDCERVIAVASGESTLLQSICNVMVTNGYRMAWAGVLDEEGSLAPVAITGAHHGYLEHLAAPLRAGLRGHATLGQALRTRQPVIVNNFDSDPRLAQWRAHAHERGYRSKIVLALFHEETPMGVLNVYADEQDAFDATEVDLMAALGQRVSAAIQTLRHRSARQAAETALHLRQRAIEASINAIVIMRANAPDFPVEYVNPAFERMTGYGADEMLGHSCKVLLAGDKDQPGLEEIRAALYEQRQAKAVVRNYRKDGSLFWNEVHVAPVKDEQGVVRHFIAAQYDITAMKRYEAELEHQAMHDSLTGLPNRVLLQERLAHSIAYAARSERPIWVAFVDLDRFKVVNDTLGHKAGDALLRTISTRLQSVVRDSDTVARLGGDEFTLILAEREDSSLPLSHDAVQRILHAVAQPVLIEGHEFFPTCSIGVAVYPGDGADPETLMSHADIAMYRAKQLGRNNFQFFSQAMNEQTLERLHLEGELRHALERGELALHYQPQVSLHSGAVVGMEALLRWNHPELGMVPPGRFIALAEETGLIVPIGAWVLRTACLQAMRWQRNGLGHLRVAVNLSARQFVQQNLVQSIAAVLADTGLAPGCLEIELTESLVMSDVERAIGILHELKALGVKLAIDDFGTGYSSLSYLKRFPIDVLKIDRSFVCDISTDANDAAIVASIIALSHNLKLQVIAEGVESHDQLAYLRRHGCDELQGYYFSKPLTAEAFEQLMRKRPNLGFEMHEEAA